MVWIWIRQLGTLASAYRSVCVCNVGEQEGLLIMDRLLAQFQLIPFWGSIVQFTTSYGVSEEMTLTLIIGALTTLLSILMLPKGPPALIALVSGH